MPTTPWIVLGITCATVSGSALLQCTPEQQEKKRAPLNARVAQAIAVHDVLHNKRWALEDQRDSMCDALVSTTRIALDNQAIALDDVKLTYWLPQTGGIVPDLARRALTAEHPSEELARIADVVTNKRWVEASQRGALCNALIVAQQRFMDSQMIGLTPGES